MSLWKRTAIISLFGGMGFSVTGAALLMVVHWYTARPPWDEQSLVVAWSSATGALKVNPETRTGEPYPGFILRFGLENRTDHDLTLVAERMTLMKRNAASKVLEGDPDLKPLPNGNYFFPARERAELSLLLDANCRDSLKKSKCYELYVGGSDMFVLFDHDSRLKVQLPKPKLTIAPEDD